jgi:hypothetical protein
MKKVYFFATVFLLFVAWTTPGAPEAHVISYLVCGVFISLFLKDLVFPKHKRGEDVEDDE